MAVNHCTSLKTYSLQKKIRPETPKTHVRKTKPKRASNTATTWWFFSTNPFISLRPIRIKLDLLGQERDRVKLKKVFLSIYVMAKSLVQWHIYVFMPNIFLFWLYNTFLYYLSLSVHCCFHFHNRTCPPPPYCSNKINMGGMYVFFYHSPFEGIYPLGALFCPCRHTVGLLKNLLNLHKHRISMKIIFYYKNNSELIGLVTSWVSSSNHSSFLYVRLG